MQGNMFHYRVLQSATKHYKALCSIFNPADPVAPSDVNAALRQPTTLFNELHPLLDSLSLSTLRGYEYS